MKKILLISVMLVFGMVTSVWALSFSGNIDSSTNGGMSATDGWSDGDYNPDDYDADALLSWEVGSQTEADGSLLWTYDYTFTVDEKGISHVINEVTADDPGTTVIETFTSDNIYAGTTPDWAINTYRSAGPGNSNPGIPGPVYGIKWDTPDTANDVLEFSWRIVTDRAPMWGDFYSKDGRDNTPGEDKIDVYAYNTGFGVDTNTTIGDGNAYNSGSAWVLVPDSDGVGGGGGDPIPEPATMLLLGTGLVGFALNQRKKFKK